MKNTGLTGTKKIHQSQTVQGALFAIVSTIGSLLVVIKGGPPPEILIPAVGTAAGAIWGSIISIFGRKNATTKIK